MTNATPAASAIAASPSASAPLSGTGREVDRQHERRRRAATERMPPRLSTGSTVSLTCAGTSSDRQHERDDGQRQRDEEHRTPPEVLEQRARRPAGRARRSRRRCADHSAMDLVRPGPDHSAVIKRERRRVGHARRDAAEEAGDEQHAVGRARTRRAGTRAPTARRRGPASSCGRSGRRARRGTAPTPRGRASSRPRSGRASVCDESNALPMSGSATLATARFRFATAATRILRPLPPPTIINRSTTATTYAKPAAAPSATTGSPSATSTAGHVLGIIRHDTR